MRLLLELQKEASILPEQSGESAEGAVGDKNKVDNKVKMRQGSF